MLNICLSLFLHPTAGRLSSATTASLMLTYVFLSHLVCRCVRSSSRMNEPHPYYKCVHIPSNCRLPLNSRAVRDQLAVRSYGHFGAAPEYFHHQKNTSAQLRQRLVHRCRCVKGIFDGLLFWQNLYVEGVVRALPTLPTTGIIRYRGQT